MPFTRQNGFYYQSQASLPIFPRPGCHDSNANSMAANVDENGTVNSMAANVDIDKTQNASGWLGPEWLAKVKPD